MILRGTHVPAAPAFGPHDRIDRMVELCDFTVSRQAVSKPIIVLEEPGLVTVLKNVASVA